MCQGLFSNLVFENNCARFGVDTEKKNGRLTKRCQKGIILEEKIAKNMFQVDITLPENYFKYYSSLN